MIRAVLIIFFVLAFSYAINIVLLAWGFPLVDRGSNSKHTDLSS